MLCVFFKQKTAYEMRIRDWSSDVCSSDLASTSPATGRVLHAYEICCDKRPEHSLGRATPTSLPGDGFPPFCAFRPQRAASNRQPAAAEDESRSRTSSKW